jgi:phage gp45-like
MSVVSRILETVHRGVLVAYQSAAGTLPRVQYRSSGVDSDSAVELLEPAGLASAPAAGANVVALNIGSDADHAVAMVQDSTNRPSLAAGETAIHALGASGKAIVVGSSTIKLGVGASKSVTRQGDTITVAVSPASNLQLYALLAAASAAAEIISGVPGSFPVPATITGTVGPGSSVVKAVD